jgi:hypothetical protein
MTKIHSKAMGLHLENIEKLRNELAEYASNVCREAENTPLPPLRAINHSIPLIDKKKLYTWHPSHCPELLKNLWNLKRDVYLKSGCWHIKPSSNAMPMLMLRKPGPKSDPLKLHTVIDLHERNANMVRLASPLPDMEMILQ